MRPIHVSSFILILLAGCGGTSPVTLREPDEYFGCATDENWQTFDLREQTAAITISDAQAPSFSFPAPGAMLPATFAPTFAWQTSQTAVGKPTGDAICAACPACGALVAQHEPPVSGNVYDLQFSIDGTLAWRTLTTLQTWTPSAAAWSLMAGHTVTLRPTSALLADNAVTAGPFQPATLPTFTVTR